MRCSIVQNQTASTRDFTTKIVHHHFTYFIYFLRIGSYREIGKERFTFPKQIRYTNKTKDRAPSHTHRYNRSSDACCNMFLTNCVLTELNADGAPISSVNLQPNQKTFTLGSKINSDLYLSQESSDSGSLCEITGDAFGHVSFPVYKFLVEYGLKFLNFIRFL